MGCIKTLNGNFPGMCAFHFHEHFHRDEYKPKGLELVAKSKWNAHFPFGNSVWEFWTIFEEISFSLQIFLWRWCYTRQRFVQFVLQQFKSRIAAVRDQRCHIVQWFLQLVSQWPLHRILENQLNVSIGWWAQIVVRQIVARGVTLSNFHCSIPATITKSRNQALLFIMVAATKKLRDTFVAGYV